MAPAKGDEVLEGLGKLGFPDSVKEMIKMAREKYADELKAAHKALDDHIYQSARRERLLDRTESQLLIVQQRLTDAEEVIKEQEDALAEAAQRREAEELKKELRRVHALVSDRESDLHAAEDRVEEMRTYSDKQESLIEDLRERAAASKSDAKNKGKIILKLEEEMGNLRRELESLERKKVVLRRRQLASSSPTNPEDDPSCEVTELLKVLEDRHEVIQDQVRGIFRLLEGEYAMRRLYERLAKFAVKPQLAICPTPFSSPGQTRITTVGSSEDASDDELEDSVTDPMDFTRFGEPLSPYPPPPPERLLKNVKHMEPLKPLAEQKRPPRRPAGYRTKTTKPFIPGERKRKRGAERNPLEEMERIQGRLANLTLGRPPSSRSLHSWVQNERGVCQGGARKRRHLDPLPRRPGDEYAWSVQNIQQFVKHMQNIRATKEPDPVPPGLPRRRAGPAPPVPPSTPAAPGLDREAVVKHNLAPEVRHKASIQTPLYLNLPPPPPPRWKALPFTAGRKFRVTHQEWCMACASRLQHELDAMQLSPRATALEYGPDEALMRPPLMPAPQPPTAHPPPTLWPYMALALFLGFLLWRLTRVDSQAWLEANDLPPALLQRIEMRREAQNQMLRMLDFEMSQWAGADWTAMG